VYILLDKSSSMLTDNKWEQATTAIGNFFRSPDAAGLGVALEFFPYGPAPCLSSHYKVPTVDVGTLIAEVAPTDAHEQALIDALDNEDATGVGTPTFPALTGAYAWADEYSSQHAARTMVLLVTDGDPQGCGTETIDQYEALASGALNDHGVYTYVIGLEGATPTDLHKIAAAGGTAQAFVLGSGSLTDDLLDTLEQIKVSQIACEFTIPEPREGTIDFNLVNVCFTNGQGAITTWGNVEELGHCSASGGWYYDIPTAPTKVVLCPTTCQQAQGDPQASIDTVFGCEMVVY